MSGLFLLQTAAERLAAARSGLDTPIGERLLGVVGMVSILAIAALMSHDRKRIRWRLVATALGLQAVFAVIVLKTSAGREFFRVVGELVTGLLAFTQKGAGFVFGNLVNHTVPVGQPGPGGVIDPGAGLVAETAASFAFSVLPTIIFFSSLMSVLYYLGLMQRVVKGIAWVMQKTLGTSGAETLSASGNIFLGQTEAPLLIKPFVKTMTSSELMTVMVGGFATVAGGVLAAYVGMLSGVFPGIAGHLIAASVLNAPAGILISKMLQPELGEPVTKGTLHMDLENPDQGAIEAAANGAAQGVQLAINVAAMLIAFVALVYLIDAGLGWVGGFVGLHELSLRSVLGMLLRPLAWVMGVPWAETPYVGGIVGLKVALNEFFAYAQFGADLSAGVALSPRSAIITTYALLGFANFSSIAIQIGGIGGLAPERRSEIARLGLRAMIGGNLAAFLSATLVGMLA